MVKNLSNICLLFSFSVHSTDRTHLLIHLFANFFSFFFFFWISFSIYSPFIKFLQFMRQIDARDLTEKSLYVYDLTAKNYFKSHLSLSFLFHTYVCIVCYICPIYRSLILITFKQWQTLFFEFFFFVLLHIIHMFCQVCSMIKKSSLFKKFFVVVAYECWCFFKAHYIPSIHFVALFSVFILYLYPWDRFTTVVFICMLYVSWFTFLQHR